jgi:hypothetical protein
MISLLFPSRKRAHRAAELCRSVARTADQSKVEVVIRIDDDDERGPYIDAENGLLMVMLFWGPRQKYLSGTYNELYKASHGDIIGYLADDVTFATPGWDEIVREHFRQHPISLLADSSNPDDPGNVPMHGFVSRRAAEAVGYLLPGCFEHGYADRWMLDLYRRAGAPVVFTNRYHIAHHHWHAEPGVFDEVYRERSLAKDAAGLTCDDRDLVTYNAKEAERIADAEKLRCLL